MEFCWHSTLGDRNKKCLAFLQGILAYIIVLLQHHACVTAQMDARKASRGRLRLWQYVYEHGDGKIA